MLFKGTVWTDVFNVYNIRKKIKKGGCIEIMINDCSCIIVDKQDMIYNSKYIEDYLLYDDILFVKMKKSVKKKKTVK